MKTFLIALLLFIGSSIWSVGMSANNQPVKKNFCSRNTKTKFRPDDPRGTLVIREDRIRTGFA